MKKYRVLITGVGTTTALSVLKGLKKQSQYNVFVVGIDADDFVSGKYLCNHFYKVPYAKDTLEFINMISEIIKKEKIDLVVPIIDYELPIWSKLKQKKLFPKSMILISSEETLKICQDKYKTILFFKKINVPTVKTYKNGVKVNNFPVFIKPRFFGRATIDAYKVNDVYDLEFYTKKMKDNYIVEEFIDGEEYTIDCLSSFKGKFITGVVRKRIEIKGGLSVKGEVVNDPKALNYAKKIVDRLKLPGVCNIQFFKKDNKYYFFEINPRFAGTHALTLEAGLNTVFHILEMLSGKKVKVKNIKITYGLKMIRYWDEIIVNKEGSYTKHYLNSY